MRGYAKLTSTDEEEYRPTRAYVDDNGIHFPVENYVRVGCSCTYRTIPKDIFVEAYNRFIRDCTESK